MTGTKIDIDEKACVEIMRQFQLETKRNAVNSALRSIAAQPMSLDKAKAMRGSGWDGDLDEMSANRAV